MNTTLWGLIVDPAPGLRYTNPLSPRAWNGLLLGTVIVILGLVFFVPPTPLGDEVAAIFVTTSMLVLCAGAIGRSSLHSGRSTIPLQIACVGIAAAGSYATDKLMWIQLFVYPAIWLSSRTVRHALVMNIVLCLVVSIACGLGLLAREELGIDNLLLNVTFQLVGIVVSMGYGLWTTWLLCVVAERDALLEQVSRAQHRMELLSREIGAEQERKRIARDLHDAIAQSLVSQVMIAQKLQTTLIETVGRDDPRTASVELLRDTADDALREARTLIAANALPAAPDAALQDAFASMISRFERETGILVERHIDPEVDRLPTREAEVVLIRIVQEGLANVRKHSGAGKVRVRITTGDTITLEVADDGAGLSICPAEREVDTGFGLSGMRERVALLGGTLRLTNGPGPAARPGTILQVELPTSTRQSCSEPAR